MRKVSNLLSLIVLCVSLAACGTMGGPATEDSSGTSSGGAQAKSRNKELEIILSESLLLRPVERKSTKMMMPLLM